MLKVNTSGVAGEDGVRAVALMDVEVDDGRAAHAPLAPQQPDRDGDVVEHAEALAVIGEGVMRSAGEVHRDAVLQRMARRGDRAADGAIRALDERLRPGKAEPAQLGRVERAARGTGARSRACARARSASSLTRSGIEHVIGRHDPFGDHRLAQHRVLRHREAMALGERKGVPRRRPEHERHRRPTRLTRARRQRDRRGVACRRARRPTSTSSPGWCA